MKHLDRESFKEWIASRVDEGDWIAVERYFNPDVAIDQAAI